MMVENRTLLQITVVLIPLLWAGITGYSQSIVNDFQLQTAAKLTFDPLKRVKISFTPEVRFNNDFVFDQYLIEGEATYKPVKFFSSGISYRFSGNRNNKGEVIYSTRFAIFAETEKKINRITPSLRISYSNDADDELNSNYLRVKTGLLYNIRNCKITPELGVEAFYDLTNANFSKIRYVAGVRYKLFKNNSIGIDYKFDYYLQEYRNKHILAISYKFNF